MSRTSNFDHEIGRRYQVGKIVVTIETTLAEGGFAVVFLARGAGRDKYALKRLYVNEETQLQNCKREIQIMSSLFSHKNIITFVGSSITKDHKGVYEVLILMDYCPETCINMLNERGSAGFREVEVLCVFCDVCEAVSRLHHCQTPIIHRDLKIENILRESSGVFVLCDFGSATARCYIPGKDERSIGDVQDDINKNTTLSHRAPEMVDLYAHKSVTTKADIWALGVTLYRLCFKTLPFGESTLAIQSANFTIPENSRYSKGLHALIYYCLNPDPDKRPDIFQVCYLAFQLAKRKSPVKNINKAPLPDLAELVLQLEARNSRLARPLTPRAADRSERIETTTVTPRERPKAGRNNQAAGMSLASQRKLVPDISQSQSGHLSVPSALPQQLAQNQSITQTSRIVPQSVITPAVQSADPQHLQSQKQPQFFHQFTATQSAYVQCHSNSQQPAPLFVSQSTTSSNVECDNINTHIDNPFDDDFSKADPAKLFSAADSFGALADPVSSEVCSSTSDSVSAGPHSIGFEDSFKVPPVPDIKYKCATAAESSSLTPPPVTRAKQSHRRNVSDTSAISLGKGSSAFRVYASHKSQNLAASLGSINSAATATYSACSKSKSASDSLSDLCIGKPSKSVSAEILGEGSWNPFGGDNDSINDDVTFGQEFDRLRCGSQSSIQNVKSREDLVMVEDENVDRDPFGAAPFDPSKAKPNNKRKPNHSGKQATVGERYSRLKHSASEEDSLNYISKSQNATIFGVPIPFTRKVDRTDRYQKVPTDSASDNEGNSSLLNKNGSGEGTSSSSDDEDDLNGTLKASQYKSISEEYRSESLRCESIDASNTPTTASVEENDVQIELDIEIGNSTCNSITVTPTRNERLEDPFVAAPFKRSKVPNNFKQDKIPIAVSTADTPILIDNCPIPILPNNPFLGDMMHVQTSAIEEAGKIVASGRNREFSFSELASERTDVEAAETVFCETRQRPILPASTSLEQKQQFIQTEDLMFMSRPLGNQGFLTLPRMTRSHTVEPTSASTSFISASTDQSSHLPFSMKRSQTSYEVNHKNDVHMDSLSAAQSGDKSENDTLLTESTEQKNGSLRRKVKGRKSPKAKTAKSPRNTIGNKKSLAYGDSESEGEGYGSIALTNEGFYEHFSEQETASITEAGDLVVTTGQTSPPKLSRLQPKPPTAPKPKKGLEPVRTRPFDDSIKVKKVPPPIKPKPKDGAMLKVSASQATEQQNDEDSLIKDPYKTHRRYSSYDLATGRAELTTGGDHDNGKLALVKGGKAKKKNRIGLGLF